MKRSLAAALVLVAACGSLDHVDLTRTATVTIPGAPAGAPGGSIPRIQALDIGGGEALRSQGIDRGDIDSAHLRRLLLSVKSGASLESWLDSLALHVEAAGLPRVRVASRSGLRSLPAGTTSVDLDVDPGVDLKPYLTAPSAPLTVEASGKLPSVVTAVEITATLRVDVNVSGFLH
jgi:hypothetical protein